jgi:hypothetical protein
VAAAVDGETIQLPAGNFIWGASATYIGLSKAVILKGAGESNTIITLATNAGTYGSATIRITAAATVRDLTIAQPSSTGGGSAISLAASSGWRITSVTYNGRASVPGYFIIVTGTYGLIDHCTINGGSGTDEFIFVRGPTDSWQTPSSMGTVNAVYIEDCTLNLNGYTDFNSNARAVVRFCTITAPIKIDAHGLASNTPARSARHTEVYNNTWTTTYNYFTAFEIRGGTCMLFNNTNSNSKTGWFLLTDYGYRGLWPNFGNVYQTPNSYPISDQIGVGMDPKVKASEPAYVWGNTQMGAPWARTLKAPAADAITLYQTQTGNATATFTEADLIKANRDFYADAGFDGTGAIGSGTKAQMLASVPSVVNAGWWVTDEGSWNTKLPANTSGQLYVWNGSSWALRYTPFTYPHTLQSGSVASAPADLNVSISIK